MTNLCVADWIEVKIKAEILAMQDSGDISIRIDAQDLRFSDKKCLGKFPSKILGLIWILYPAKCTATSIECPTNGALIHSVGKSGQGKILNFVATSSKEPWKPHLSG